MSNKYSCREFKNKCLQQYVGLVVNSLHIAVHFDLY